MNFVSISFETAAFRTSQPATTISCKKRGHDDDDETIDPTAYFDYRIRELTNAQENPNEYGIKSFQLYPHKFNATLSIPHMAYIYNQRNIASGERLTEIVSVAGRIYQKRSSGSSLVFYDLQADGGKIQIVADRRTDDEGFGIHQLTRRGQF